MHLYPSSPYKEHTCSTYFYTNLQYGIPWITYDNSQKMNTQKPSNYLGKFSPSPAKKISTMRDWNFSKALFITKNVYADNITGDLTGALSSGNSLTGNSVSGSTSGNSTTGNSVAGNTVVRNSTLGNSTTNNVLKTNNTTSTYNNTSLPKTGVEDSMPAVILVVVLGISAVYAYKKIQEYKNI